MSTLAFLTAVYNEEAEIENLLRSVRPYVDIIIVSDDGSEDQTVAKASDTGYVDIMVTGPHLASCEETRIRGFAFVEADWVLILDADERISADGMKKLRIFTDRNDPQYTHVYFSQDEFIDNVLTRTFPKIKLARPQYLNLPVGIHDDISCTGESTNIGVRVLHRKTSAKQRQRETEYVQAYERKIIEGKMTRQRAEEVKGWHYYVRE
jgi:glycosyltransferase involved in cell wall biosynthesis